MSKEKENQGSGFHWVNIKTYSLVFSVPQKQMLYAYYLVGTDVCGLFPGAVRHATLNMAYPVQMSKRNSIFIISEAHYIGDERLLFSLFPRHFFSTPVI